MEEKGLRLHSYNLRYRSSFVLDFNGAIGEFQEKRNWLVNCIKCDQSRANLILIISKHLFVVDIYSFKIVKKIKLGFSGDRNVGKLRDFCYCEKRGVVVLAYEDKKVRKNVGIYFYKIYKDQGIRLMPYSVEEYDRDGGFVYYQMTLCTEFEKIFVCQVDEKNPNDQIFEAIDVDSSDVRKIFYSKFFSWDFQLKN